MDGYPPKFELAFDGACQRYVLCNVITEEKCFLEEGSWETHTSAEGAMYLASLEGREALLCDDCMEVAPFQHPKKPLQWMVVLDSGECMTLEKYQQRHSPHVVPIQCLGRANLAELAAFVLSQPVAGSHVLWGLGRLYRTFVANDNSTCSKWYQNWWSWWRKMLSSSGLQ